MTQANTAIVSNGDTSDTPAAAAASAGRRFARPWFTWPSETFALKWLFRSMLIACAAFLVYDFQIITEQANTPLPGSREQGRPVTMRPPRPDDHVRPYLPLSRPTLQRSKSPPRMPGWANPPSSALMAKPMAFRRGPKGSASAVGRIEPGTGAAFAIFLAVQSGEIKRLYLHSPGGSVRDALQMSRALRKAKIEAVVPRNAYCASSCPIVLSGGAERRVSRKAWVGVHQIFAATKMPGGLAEGMSQGQSVTAQVQDHFDKMGIDLRAWVHALKTPPQQLYVFTPEQLRQYKLATKLTK